MGWGKMIMTGIVIEKILEMFILMLVGVIVYKAKVVDETISKNLSNLLLMVVTPLLILKTYQTDFNMELFQGLLITLAASAVTFFVFMALAAFLFPGKEGNHQLEQIGTVYSNCSFIGVPLANGILGAEGVFYMTAYITAFNLILWTLGIRVMASKDGGKSSFKELINPSILAVLAGIVCFVTGFRLPKILMTPIEQISGMNTPLAMLVAGINLARGNILESLKNRRLYLICLVKLIVFPLIGLVLLIPMRLSFVIAFTVFIGVACPSGATTIMFSERYGKNTAYATEIFVLTTLLSLITIPLLSIPAIHFLQ